MMTTQVTESLPISWEIDSKNQILPLIDSIIHRFHSTIRSYAMFNLFFFLFFISQLTYISLHFTFLLQSFVLAMALGLCFVTIFCYFTLKIYFQTKKVERFSSLKEDYVFACKDIIHYQHGNSEHHMMLANACAEFAAALHGKEYAFYRPPEAFAKLTPLFDRISCWCHWDDVYTMREMLLMSAVDEHIKIVKCYPTDLASHAGLANAYVMLSGLYVDPRSIEGFDDDRWIPPHKYDGKIKDKFRLMSERAIEEFKILNDYAPRDPWVHAQLAYSYHDLQMPNEEIKEYEMLLQLCPDDREVLFKLGQLYFQQGRNAEGLQIYEQLKRSHYKKAENLIHFYGG